MANEHKIKNILLNYNKGTLTVGQLDQFQTQGLTLLGLDNKVTILDLAFYYNELDKIKSKYTSNTYPADIGQGTWLTPLTSGYTEETPTVTRVKNQCKDLVVWLWGSLEKGGFGLFRRYYTDAHFAQIYSTGQYTDGTKTYYNVATGWQSFTPNYTPNVAFCYLFVGTPDTDGSYFNNIAIIKSRNSTEIMTAYNGAYDGSANMRYLYDKINPVTSYDVSVVITEQTNNWINESLVSSHQISMYALGRASSFVNYYIFDDTRNEWGSLVHLHGHWYGDDYEEDPNDGDGGNGAQGGGGNYDKTNDPVDKTDTLQFANDAFGTGFINVYNPTKAELLSLANILCTGVSKNISLMLKKLFINPLDYIVALNMCHFNVPTDSAQTVKLGGWDTGIAMNVIPTQFKIMNGGSLYIPHNFNNFLDYYVRTKIYIPYCGVHDLPTDLIMGGTLSIQYIVDCLTGAMIAELYLTRDRSNMHGAENAQSDGYMWSYSGNCFVPIPIGNLDYRNSINAVLGLVSGVGTTIATGNPAPIAGSVASAVMNGKPTFEVGSNIGSNYGYMTAQTPFIILEEPIQNRPTEFIAWRGYPSNTLHTIDSYSGYTEIDTDTFWTDTFTKPITEAETEELKTILNNGFYV